MSGFTLAEWARATVGAVLVVVVGWVVLVVAIVAGTP